MLEVPVTMKVIPLVAAALIAITPLKPEFLKLPTEKPYEAQGIAHLETGKENWGSDTTTNTTKNKKGETIQTENKKTFGFKTIYVPGKVYGDQYVPGHTVKLPFSQEIIVEKNVNEVVDEIEDGKENESGNKYMENDSQAVTPKKFSITKTVYNTSKSLIKKIASWI